MFIVAEIFWLDALTLQAINLSNFSESLNTDFEYILTSILNFAN